MRGVQELAEGQYPDSTVAPGEEGRWTRTERDIFYIPNHKTLTFTRYALYEL